MDEQTFRNSLSAATPPQGLTPTLEALWYAGKEDWHTAHDRLQGQNDQNAAWVHAYLHRWEGDAANAAYWYRRASKPVAQGELRDEWDTLVSALFADGSI